MKNITTHGFVILVVSMVIVISFQLLNFFNDENYRQSSERARIEAVTDRASLKSLIQISNDRDEAVQQQLVNLLSRVYSLTNTTNSTHNEALVNATQQTNMLLSFLVDNFGANSDYLQRENFQYKQANATYNYLVKGINVQDDMLKNQKIIINNQKHIIDLLNDSDTNTDITVNATR